MFHFGDEELMKVTRCSELLRLKTENNTLENIQDYFYAKN